MSVDMSRPAFEIIDPLTGNALRIWPDGRTEGFFKAIMERYGATCIINRIPVLLCEAEERARNA